MKMARAGRCRLITDTLPILTPAISPAFVAGSPVDAGYDVDIVPATLVVVIITVEDMTCSIGIIEVDVRAGSDVLSEAFPNANEPGGGSTSLGEARARQCSLHLHGMAKLEVEDHINLHS